jgi:hypothetical protein
MFTIGDFARLGRVSVRMLRHYRTDGFAREVYLEYCRDEPEKNVTELQMAVTPG